MRVVTAAEMQALDRQAIEEYHIPGMILMENAGLRVVEAIGEYLDISAQQNIHCFVGKGNNGGDGFVIARHLHLAGHEIMIWLLADPAGFQGDALTNFRIAEKMGIPQRTIVSVADMEDVEREISSADIVIDALFGTGLTSAPRKLYGAVIECINRTSVPVVAVDMPSGLHPDTGVAFEPCIEADLTVTFGLPKIGQILYPGASYCGQLVVGDISFPPDLIENAGTVELLHDPEILGPLVDRAPQAHKGTYGHLLALAGSVGKTGAAALLAEAAVRVGTGLVTVGIPQSLNDIMEVKLTEAMTEPLPETEQRSLSLEAIPRIRDLCERMTALALGPGLSSHHETRQAVRELLRSCDLPLVIDADGLNVLAGELEILKSLAPEQAILTPHPGEMARLLNCTNAEIQQDRLGAARRLASETQCVVVLKGARTLITTPDGEVRINMTGNPGMASGGTGDVLTGLIGGLLAQGFSTRDAAMMGVYLHGRAADMAVEETGEASLAAGDIIAAVSKALTTIRDM